jgi:hypothetical protein
MPVRGGNMVRQNEESFTLNIARRMISCKPKRSSLVFPRAAFELGRLPG